MVDTKQVTIDILTDKGWKEATIYADEVEGMDSLDQEVEITERATQWCSQNGYSYETWEAK